MVNRTKSSVSTSYVGNKEKECMEVERPFRTPKRTFYIGLSVRTRIRGDDCDVRFGSRGRTRQHK